MKITRGFIVGVIHYAHDSSFQDHESRVYKLKKLNKKMCQIIINHVFMRNWYRYILDWYNYMHNYEIQYQYYLKYITVTSIRHP